MSDGNDIGPNTEIGVDSTTAAFKSIRHLPIFVPERWRAFNACLVKGETAGPLESKSAGVRNILFSPMPFKYSMVGPQHQNCLDKLQRAIQNQTRR